MTLDSFMVYLVENGLIDATVLQDDTPSGLINRMKVQKLCYIAQERFNLSLNCNFSMYIYGPYSPSLADYYYNLDLFQFLVPVDDEGHYAFDVPPLPTEFNKSKFLTIFKNRNESWLELAATLIDATNYYSGKEELIDTVSKIKPRYNVEQIRAVDNDLKGFNLIS